MIKLIYAKKQKDLIGFLIKSENHSQERKDIFFLN
jgi:hypothetical protein